MTIRPKPNVKADSKLCTIPIVVNLVGKFTDLKKGSEVIIHAVTWQIETVALSPTCLQLKSV